MHPVLGISLLLGLAGGFMMFVPTAVALGMHSSGEKSSDPNFHIGLLAFGAFGLILTVTGVALWFWQSSRLANDPRTSLREAPITYYVYEDALVLSRNDELIRLPWDDLAFHQEGDWGASYQISHGGQKYPIKTNVKDYGQLIGTVISEIESRVIPAWLAALDAGQSVCLGPFSFTKDTIALRGNTLRWYEIGKIWAEDTDLGCYIKIRQAPSWVPGNEWCAERTSSFAGEPNAFFFFDLLKHLVPSHLLVEGDAPALIG
jgi:hypothetical protein